MSSLLGPPEQIHVAPQQSGTLRKKIFRLGMAYTLRNLGLISFRHIRPIEYEKP